MNSARTSISSSHPAHPSHLSHPPSHNASTTSLLTPQILTLSDATTPQIDGLVPELIDIELVRVLRESAREGLRRSRAAGEAVRDEEVEAETERRLEAIGYQVGQALVERLTIARPPLPAPLEIVKMVCKDVWMTAFGKQVDNLRTNHRGVFVLQDNAFKPLLRISSPMGSADAVKRAKPFLAFPSGIVRGALGRLGLHTTVSTEISQLPQCTFQVKTVRTS